MVYTTDEHSRAFSEDKHFTTSVIDKNRIHK